MAVGSIESLTLIVLILIAVVCAQNEPDVEYTCDQSGMHIDMDFDDPFRGLVYVEGFKMDPKCRLAFNVPVLEASFNIPLMACDLTMPRLTVVIMIQQHPLLPTINDTSEVIIDCIVKINSNVTNWIQVSSKAQSFLKDYPNVISWLEFGLAPGIFDDEMELHPKNTNFMAFRVYGANQFNDMLVTECIAHDEAFIAQNTSIRLMTEPIGCPYQSTEMLSTFNVTKSDRDVIIGAYAEFNPLSIPNPEQSFISCSAVLCMDKCRCSQNSSALGFQVFATRKLVPRRDKRSASDETIASSNNGNDGIRNRFMRSTIKALTDRLMNYRRQNRMEKEDTDFKKRSIPYVDEVTTAKLTTTLDSESNPTFLERVPATDFNMDSNFNIETNNFDEINVSLANLSAMFMAEFELEKYMTRLYEISTESTLHRESTLKNPLSETLIPEDDIDEMFPLFELTTEYMLNPDTTISDSNEDLQQKNLLIETNENSIFILNVTTETVGLKPKDTINKTLVNEKEQNDCVPRLRFVIVTVSLSFIVVCLILGCCGLIMYMSKEKKKRALDNFLLYSFY